MRELLRKWVYPAAVIVAAVASAISCEKTEKVPIEPLEEIPTPTSLSGFLSADGVQLFWKYDSTYAYKEFAVSRSEDEQATWFEVARVPAPPYSDTNLRSQFSYWYRVQGVSQDDVLSRPSVSWPARPAVYEVIINDGAEASGSRDVMLTFTAPTGTQNVRFGESEDLQGIQWRDYLPPYPFTLSAGDGEKTVWAQFIDAAGNLTEPVGASIALDTYAGIGSLSFTTDTSTDTIAPGGTVTFSITVDSLETGGVCDIFVEGMGATPIPAYDDGRYGDSEANDGIYERVYTFAVSFRQRSMRMSAQFTDAVGNVSEEREFAEYLYMSDPPQAVDLNPITQRTSDSITLSWTRSTDNHFAAYRIYRSDQPGVDDISSILAGSVTNQVTTVFTDPGLTPNTSYWYAVYVVNDLDEGTKSNQEQQGTTNP
jgi:chitodextrinase